MATEVVVRLLIQRLSHFLDALGELGLRAEYHEALRIRYELLKMSSFIRSADAMVGRCNVTRHDFLAEREQHVRAWLEQVREISFAMEDVMNDFELYVFHDPYLEERHTSVSLLQKSIWIIYRKASLVLLLIRMQNIGLRFLNVSKQCPQDCIAEVDIGISSSLRIPLGIGETSKHPVIGIEEARDNLLQWLLEGRQELTAVIVGGMEGMGKTTLAKEVYNTLAVKKHFNFCAWFTVSRRNNIFSNILSVLWSMMRLLDPRLCEAMVGRTLVEIAQDVANCLKDKRYLVVLDDVYTALEYSGIMEALPDSKCGSRVIVTAESREIPVIGHDHYYRIWPLSDDDAWHLFRKKAFPLDCVCPTGLEDNAKKIVRKLGGLPLSIAIAGGLLLLKPQSEWLKILQRLSCEYGNTCPKIRTVMIRLGFNDLPYYLKSCLLYFCFFPKGASIRSTRLIWLWMAEGFIQAVENKTAEEVAEACLNALIARGLVQVSEFHEDGRPRRFQVHYLIQDQILAVAEEDGMLAIARSVSFATNFSVAKPKIYKRVRRLSVRYNFQQDSSLTRFRNLQSLCMSGVVTLPLNSIQMVVASFRLLKVLDLEGIPLKKFPLGIENLLLLKYLGLRYSLITELPRSVGGLVDLETLDLKGSQISTLPKEVLKLKRLRHLLVCHHVAHGVSVPEGIGMLTSLQSLGCIDAPEESSVVGELGNLINMRRLCIAKLNEGEGGSLCSSIEKMVRLQSLKVMLKNDDQTLDLQAISSPPASLQKLHLKGHLEMLPSWVELLRNLVKLSLSGSRLRQDPFEILESLPKLVVLVFIRAYEGEALRCNAGGFPSLQMLKLVYLHRLGAMNAEVGAFPSLKVLHILHCPKLHKIPSFIEKMAHINPEENCQQVQLEREEDEDVLLEKPARIKPEENKQQVQLERAEEEDVVLEKMSQQVQLKREEEEVVVLPVFKIQQKIALIARIFLVFATFGGILSYNR